MQYLIIKKCCINISEHKFIELVLEYVYNHTGHVLTIQFKHEEG